MATHPPQVPRARREEGLVTNRRIGASPVLAEAPNRRVLDVGGCRRVDRAIHFRRRIIGRRISGDTESFGLNVGFLRNRNQVAVSNELLNVTRLAAPNQRAEQMA